MCTILGPRSSTSSDVVGFLIFSFYLPNVYYCFAFPATDHSQNTTALRNLHHDHFCTKRRCLADFYRHLHRDPTPLPEITGFRQAGHLTIGIYVGFCFGALPAVRRRPLRQSPQLISSGTPGALLVSHEHISRHISLTELGLISFRQKRHWDTKSVLATASSIYADCTIGVPMFFTALTSIRFYIGFRSFAIS